MDAPGLEGKAHPIDGAQPPEAEGKVVDRQQHRPFTARLSAWSAERSIGPIGHTLRAGLSARVRGPECYRGELEAVKGTNQNAQRLRRL